MEVVEAYEDEAYLNDMDLEEYVDKVLNLNKDEFYNMCYEEGADLIKSYLVIGAIAEKESLTVSDKEIDEFDTSIVHDERSKEVDTYIAYQILENKFYALFISE